MTGPQTAFWTSPAKYRAFVGGIGSGKSFAGCIEILRQPGGTTGMVTAPTYPMLRDATLEAFLSITRPYGLLAEFHKQEMRARLVNGTTVLFRTADDPERLRGSNLSWWYGDEASLCTLSLYQIMRGRLRIAPGKCWLTFTPKGKGWLYDEFVTRATPDHCLVHATTDSNTFLPPDFAEGLRGTYSEMFARQELGGEWIDESEDRLILDSWLDRCVLAKRQDGANGGQRWLSMDVSKGSGRDRTVAFVGDALGLLACEVSNRIDLPGAANLVATMSRRWGIPHDRIVYDAGGWAGPELGQYLEAVGITSASPYFGSASGKARFTNQRSRCGWALRQRLTPDRPRLLDPPRIDPHSFLPEVSHVRTPAPPISDTQPPFVIPPSVIGPHWGNMRDELAELRYHHEGAKIAMESKADLVDRLGHSPDLADTLLMAASMWRA